ncbi:MAG: L-rhamnose isomerase [Acholeplasmataceae bacterium]
MTNYELARKAYQEIGVDTEEAINALGKVRLSLQCWQTDDVKGFLFKDNALTGGIQVTGNYKGRARTPQEVKDDLSLALSLIPGNHKVNLHAIYADTDEAVDLDQIEPRHFKSWVDWAKKEHIGLDFNPTCFSHEKSSDGFTLSHPDQNIRDFWIKHCIQSRKIGAYFQKELKQPSVVNLWIPDGFKDNPYDLITPRVRLKESLDEIYQEKLDVTDVMESKLFGIGSEAYTVGSHEFYLSYVLLNKLGVCFDTGHFHLTESVADKIASLSVFNQTLLLHVSRPVRWDSDHVVIFDDETSKIAQVLVRGNLLDKVHIGFDFFDASISRVSALVIGARSFQLALMKALLEPKEALTSIELNKDYSKRLYYQEMLKGLPYGIVYDEFLKRHHCESQHTWFDKVRAYEERLDR